LSQDFDIRHSKYDLAGRQLVSEALRRYGVQCEPHGGEHDPLFDAFRRSRHPLAKALRHRPDLVFRHPTSHEPYGLEVKGTDTRATFSVELGAYQGILDWNAALASDLLLALVIVDTGAIWLAWGDDLPDPPTLIRLPQNPADLADYQRKRARIQEQYPDVPLQPANWNPDWTNMAYVVVDPRRLRFQRFERFVAEQLGLQLPDPDDAPHPVDEFIADYLGYPSDADFAA